MAERSSIALRVRDLSRVGLTVTAVTASDMAETHNTWVWRTRRDGEDVLVERSLNAGVNWQSITVGTSRVAVPTLATDRWDNVWCWFGDMTTAYGVVSYDYGESWQQIGQHLGGAPRMAVAPEYSYLALHDGGTTLTIYGSGDGGASLTPLYAVPDVPKQLAALELDRRDVLHVLYRNDDMAIYHRWSNDPAGGVFSGATQWATGQFPVLAFGQDQRQRPDGGLFAWFADGQLNLQATDATGVELSGSITVPSGTYTPGYVGLLLDRRNTAWITAKPAGLPVKSIFSPSLIGWSDP